MRGKYDGFLIATFPDGTGPAAAVASTGAVSRFETHEIFDQDAQMRIMKAAKDVLGSYKAPTD